jgi:uncharacterized iron-regulated protein
MKQLLTILAATVIMGISLGAKGDPQNLRLFNVATGVETTLNESISVISKNKQIILVGEYHDDESHHTAQLLVIRALRAAGVPVAIGLEMFRAESQDNLDRWITGQLSEKDFEKVYYDNWNYPWVLYSGIFEYAKDMRIPLVGLNVPRAITLEVAQEGFRSLSKEERAKLPDVKCDVDEDYMAFIRKAHGEHAHGNLNFAYFCEAQLVWDTVMAVNALDYIEVNPSYTMVLLTGTGHAWKRGIPAQIGKRSELQYIVFLPQVPKSIEPGLISVEDADYIILGS